MTNQYLLYSDDTILNAEGESETYLVKYNTRVKLYCKYTSMVNEADRMERRISSCTFGDERKALRGKLDNLRSRIKKLSYKIDELSEFINSYWWQHPHTLLPEEIGENALYK